jgi:hypothetical protein
MARASSKVCQFIMKFLTPGAASMAVVLLQGGNAAADELANACPVDGCEVRIVSVKKSGNELALTLESNFKPDMSKNHVHVWWGDNYTVEQITNNAETVYKVKQGDWHPTDEYPNYVTQSAASVSVRGSAVSLCVSASDRNHDILDTKKFHCMNVSGQL